MALSHALAAATGLYTGDGDGDESGPFVSRIDVSTLPNGGAMIRYLATSRDEAVLHLEQTMLVAGPDGDQLVEQSKADARLLSQVEN